MRNDDDILNLLRKESVQAERKAQRGIIIQPGAIGDCIQTLPLAKFMKKSLGLGGVDVLGHTEYIGILPGRTCVDSIQSIDSANLHRLFVKRETFDLADGDPLINAFAPYAWIVTFLGEPDSDFEHNLIFTANCSHSAEVMILSMKPPENFRHPLAEFHINQFVDHSGLSFENWPIVLDDILIQPTSTDRDEGSELLVEAGIDIYKRLVVIHPGSGGLHKCWHLDNFLSVAEKLAAENFEVLFLLGPAECARFHSEKLRDMEDVGVCLSDLSLTQVVGILSCANGFIGNDSGITHLAAALGMNVFVVFGPTNPAIYIPIGPKVQVLVDKSATFAKQPSANLQKELLDVLMADIS